METTNLGKQIKEIFSTKAIIKNFRFFYKYEKIYKDFFKNTTIYKFLNNKDLRATVDAFFANQLNISKTAKATFTHRNTLNYRLNKIEKFTSLNIKTIEDAIILHNLLTVYNNLSL